MLIMKFKSQKEADDFYRHNNNQLFNSIESNMCHLVYIDSIETISSSKVCLFWLLNFRKKLILQKESKNFTIFLQGCLAAYTRLYRATKLLHLSRENGNWPIDYNAQPNLIVAINRMNLWMESSQFCATIPFMQRACPNGVILSERRICRITTLCYLIRCSSSSCPVCRYTVTPDFSFDSVCTECGSQEVCALRSEVENSIFLYR